MGLSARHPLIDWASHAYWLTRYWLFDTDDGKQARVAMLCVAVMVLIFQLIKLSVAAYLQVSAPQEPVKAIYWWVVQLIIAIVAAIAVYALTPKVEAPPARQQDMPTVDDGQSVLEIHGDCRIKDELIGAQVVIGKEPIKGKGKK